jgi:hypothetical protein
MSAQRDAIKNEARGRVMEGGRYLMEMVLVVLSMKLESSVKGPNHSSTLLNHSIVTASSRAAIADGLGKTR